MSDIAPNKKQQQLVDAVDGIYLVNAGPGTGKTFTIKHRYANLMQNGVAPDDILLITYTRNGAENMKERIIDHVDDDPGRLTDVPITTFHSYCYDLLKEHGLDAPQYLGIDDRIGSSTRIIEDSAIEQYWFDRFYQQFKQDHPAYRAYYRIVDQSSNLRDLIQSLAVKGAFPTRDGWYRNGRAVLEGDWEQVREQLRKVNQPRNNGKKQSRLAGKISGLYRNRTFTDAAPDKADVKQDKRVREQVIKDAFDEDRDELFRFIHDLYFEYIQYALERNYVNFSFVLMFAYLLLMEDDQVREEVGFEHVMVDEFQDSNEIQLKLTMLLSGTGNIAVVGDWRQSIFSFQHTTVKNIQAFRTRLPRFKKLLNDERERITYSCEPTAITTIDLQTNYRSTAAILDTAPDALTTPGMKTREKDTELDVAAIEDQYTELVPETDSEETEVAAYSAEDEHAFILAKIQELVDNPDYTITREEDGETITEQLSYSDIAVLTRNRTFGLELQEKAKEHGIPLVFEGGVELFSEPPGILLLAWLRILNNDRDRGWTVVLDHAGYSFAAIKHILENEAYPEDMAAFRDRLAERDSIAAVARAVFTRYGLNDEYTDTIIDAVTDLFSQSQLNLDMLIQFMEYNIEERQTFDVDNSVAEDMAVAKTIHKAKGLEYPVVFVANMNESIFPGQERGGERIFYTADLGIRQTQHVIDDTSIMFDNWNSRLLEKCYMGTGYDEERRLFYVAMTRAENYLYLTAEQGREGMFFQQFPLEAESVTDVEVPEISQREPDSEELDVSAPSTLAPVKRTARSVVNEVAYEKEGGKGAAFGKEIHQYAEQYVRGADPEPGDEQDFANVRRFIDSLDGELTAEQPVLLPLETDGRRITLDGVVDLVHETDETVSIIDYKTDRSREAVEEYRKQLSVYYHVLDDLYDKQVLLRLYFTADDEAVPVQPVSKERLVSELDV